MESTFWTMSKIQQITEDKTEMFRLGKYRMNYEQIFAKKMVSFIELHRRLGGNRWGEEEEEELPNLGFGLFRGSAGRLPTYTVPAQRT